MRSSVAALVCAFPLFAGCGGASEYAPSALSEPCA